MSPLSHGTSQQPDEPALAVNPFFGQANPVSGMTEDPPKHRLADRPLAPDTAYQVVHDELMLDGNARLNL
ncbi:glutamate decarboxylase, partial [Streptomyces sp. SID4982]|nr:glutamate decarboxylase [Streptomyces sp. SID4982]